MHHAQIHCQSLQLKVQEGQSLRDREGRLEAHCHLLEKRCSYLVSCKSCNDLTCKCASVLVADGDGELVVIAGGGEGWHCSKGVECWWLCCWSSLRAGMEHVVNTTDIITGC